MGEKFTFLENIREENELNETNRIFITRENISQIVSDFSIKIENRLEAIDKYYEYYGDDIVEVLRRLVGIFNITVNSSLELYLSKICTDTNIPFEFRLETAKDTSLCHETDSCFKPLDILCSKLSKMPDIPTPKKVDAICVLMRRDLYKENSLYYFIDIINNVLLASEYRYRLITSLKHIFDLRKTFKTREEVEKIDSDLTYYEKELMFTFANNTMNTHSTRILAGQLLLSKYKCEKIEDILLDIANNKTVEYNTRADATDVVLRYGGDVYKEIAKNIIIELGKNGNNVVRNIYENAQNAHNKDVEQSAIESLEKLYTKRVITNEKLDFEDLANELISQGFSKTTINRISLDNATYSKLSITLRSALLLVYSYIKESTYKDILLERLKEELYESEGICSTGILERIVNTLTGFDDELGLRISFEDQILGNLSAKLNAKINSIISYDCIHTKICDCKAMACMGRLAKYKKCGSCVVCTKKECVHVCNEKNNCNEELVDKVLEEMIIPTKFYNKRTTFLRVFRLYISDIMEEIRNDFKDDIDIPSFDLFFKRAIINYEGEE